MYLNDKQSEESAATPSKVVFIQGAMARSGTNFLHDLLCAYTLIMAQERL